jgi:vacuolar-type H+-ATPase subunit E/Vma4
VAILRERIMAENNEDGKIKLIQGIKEDAESEAEKILEQAEKAVQEKKDAVLKQIEKILSEAKAKAEEQAAKIKKNTNSTIAVDTKRLSLKIRDRIIALTIDRVKEGILKLIGAKEYPAILSGWIVEAALGLDAGEAIVNASKDERPVITDALLREAETALFTMTGKKIKLIKSNDDPLLAQGVVLTSQDGKTAFSNQVYTRILRYQTEIRKMIQAILLSPDDSFF